MSVVGCRCRQSVEVKIFKIDPIYDMLSQVGKELFFFSKNNCFLVSGK